MNIQPNISTVNFEAKMPKKQTYRAMKNYYESKDDFVTAKIYSRLDSQAKERLHNKRSDDAQQQIFDLSEKADKSDFTVKDYMKYIAKQAKNTYVAIKEAVIGAYYGVKKGL